MRRFVKTGILPLLLVLTMTLGTKGGVLQVATGQWAPAANLAQARANSTATMLQDGRVLIVGGEGANGPLATAEFFGADGSVSVAPAMTTARSRHFAAALQDGRVLVGGGTSSNGMPLFSAEIFDPVLNTWTPAASGMTEARAGAAAALLPNGLVVVSGGDSGTRPSMTIEIFDPATGTFALVGAMSAPRTKHSMAVLRDGRVMMLGGWNGSAVLQTTDIFDPGTGQVAVGPQMLVARMNHTATTSLTGPVVIAGGNNGQDDLATVEIFNPASGTIAAGTSLATARQGQLAVLLPNNNNILYVGGTAAGAPVANAEMYSPWQATMVAAGANAIARSQAAASGTGADGVLLVSGGSDANGAAISGNELYGFATVKTDASDYAPGTTVTITGTGWKPGETVTLTLVESPLEDTHPVMTEVADANGNFVNTDFSPDTHDLNIRFFLTAIGSSSGLQAMNTFTDGKVNSVTVQSPTSSTVTAGGTATYGAVAIGVNGNNNSCTITLSASGLPADSAAVFGQSTPNFGTNPYTETGATDFSVPLSVTTTLLTPPGTYTFQVNAKDGAGCQDTNTTSSANATLIVNAATVSTSTAVTSSLNPSTYGGSVTFTAKVVPASGSTAPTGSVQFKIDGVNSGAPVAVSACAPAPDACATLSTSTLAAGNHTVEADFTGTGVFTNSTGTLSGGQNVNKVTLTASIIGDPTKPYNGDANATLTSANFSLSGLLGTDSFTVTKTAGTYNSKDVATASTVTATLAATDFTANGSTIATNYTLPTTASGAGHITAVTLTAAIIGDPTRPYNGGLNATLAPANFSLSGLVGLESFTVTQTSGTYNSKDVSTANAVTSTLAAGDFTPANGAIATNYVLPTSASGAGHITAVTLTAAIIGDPTRPYNGNANATLTSANFSLSGLVGTEAFTVTQTAGMYNSPNVAMANTVTANLAAGDFTPASGTTASNYVLPTTTSGPGHISAVTLTAAIIGDPTRPYNGNTSATLTSTNFSLSGLVGSESFSITQTVGNYNTKDVATANTITANLAVGDFTPGNGAIASNYNLPTTASGPGNITAVTLAAAIIGDPTRPYNGNTNATLTPANFSLSGLVGSESFSVTQTVGTYNSANVTAANTVNATLGSGDFTPASGTTASNYVLPTSATGAGHISAVTLTASIIGDPTRPYNGNTNATLTSANFSLSGLVGTESFTITQTAGSYNSKDVATANTVTASLAAGDFTPGNGAIASNYVLPTTASGPGHISAVTLTAAIIEDPTKFFDGSTNATLTPANFSITGLISPDSISVNQTAGSYDSANSSATTVTASLTAGNFTAGAGTLLSNYNLPTTASGLGTIKPDMTTTGVTSSVNPSIFGQSVTFTATVTNTSTAATPTGSVQFVVDGVNYGSPVAISGATNTATGTATTAAISVNGSPHSVSANFVNADGNFVNSNGALSSGQTVNPAPTSTSVSSSANPSVFGQSVTFTATVTNTAGAGISTATPSGSVQFIVDGVTFGAPIAVTGSGGVASVTSGSKSDLNVNGSPHSVKAVFTNSDGNFIGSMNTLAGGQTVTKASTSTAVQSSLNPSIFGQSVTFTATVTNTATGATPTGGVQFVVDGGVPVSAALSGSGNSVTATYSIFTLNVAGSPHSIVANYVNGDGNFSNSSGNTAQTVTKAATTTTVASSGSPSTLNQNVTFTATVADSTPMSTGTPTGAVNFYDGVNLIGSGTLNGSGVATFSTSTLAVSSHSITVQYVGDANFTGSTSSAITQVVQYNFCLLYDPTRSVKSGATYPIKIYACDANGVDVSSSAIVVHATAILQLSTVVGAPDDAGNANPDSDFRFDITLGPTGGYIFNLKTSGLATGTYMLQFTAGNDPLKHSVAFGVK